MNSPGEVIRLESVTKSYGVKIVTQVLFDIQLTLHSGELVALIGPSGSGKTTLLNLIGLLDRPTSGTITILNKDTATLTEHELTRLRGNTIGFVFQFHHLINSFTATENVMLPSYAQEKRITPVMIRRANFLLERVGLEQKFKSKPQELSGGQNQRVAIARALMMKPSLILADEPTGNLDTKLSIEIFNLMRTICKEENTTFLIVSHDPQIAQGCDRIVSLQDGEIISDQPHDGSLLQLPEC